MLANIKEWESYLKSWVFELTKEAKRELEFLSKFDRLTLEKIALLFESISVDPRSGIGKPERLKHKQIETWSRRIDRKNRIQYRIIENRIVIVSCMGHYND